ncbi:MAG: TraR/DksA family transcriptional regulator [Candidatus Omnitrophota bacterium]
MKVRNKLSKKDLNYFKKLILKRKDELMDALKHSLEDTLKKSPREAAGDISGYAFHMADLATDTYDREFSLGLASNERKIIYEIDESLKKIQEGKFGICEKCKSPISKTRLKAIPYTRLCLKCQEAQEKR